MKEREPPAEDEAFGMAVLPYREVFGAL